MFISYAQNFEDVVLWRALQHVVNGFYIDIGAQDPVVDSVSLGFYELGWRGVHVEPTNAYAQALRAARPDEIVLEVAVEEGGRLISLHEIPHTGLSTGQPDIAAGHAKIGFASRETDVVSISLAALLDRYQTREIHWLKIDVEGMESSLLRSWGDSNVRPWIIVVEAVVPLGRQTSHDAWERELLDRQYRFVYWDGLNRFYVAEGHEDLLHSFDAPPNVFDSFALAGSGSHHFTTRLNEKIANLQTLNEESLARTRALELELANERDSVLAQLDVDRFQATQWTAQIERLEAELSATRMSLSQVVTDREAADARHAAHIGDLRDSLLRRDADLDAMRSEYEGRAVRDDARLATLETEFLTSMNAQEAIRRSADSERRRCAESVEAARSREAQAALARDAAIRRIEDIERELLLVTQDLQLEASARAAAVKRTADIEKDLLRVTQDAQEKALARDAAIRRIADLEHELLLAGENVQRVSMSLASVQHESAKAVALNQAEIAVLRKKLNALQSSRSWRWTRVFRSKSTLASPFLARDAPEESIGSSIEGTKPRLTAMPKLHASRFLRSSVPDLHALCSHEGAEFVEAAYWAVLQRSPDPGGLAFYEAKLQSGLTKRGLLSALIDSKEARVRGIDVPGLRRALEAVRGEADAATSLHEMLAMDDEAFLGAAYRSLLKREMDPEGRRFYLSALATGGRRIDVLAQLYRSKERADLGVPSRWLEKALWADRMSSLPLVGRLFRNGRREQKLETVGLLSSGNDNLPGSSHESSSQSANRNDQEAMRSSVPASLDELLALHDEAFVRMAYVTVLGRQPDPAGHDFYTQRLRSGVAKVSIIREMTLSDEWRKKQLKLPGIDAVLNTGRVAPSFLERTLHRVLSHSFDPLATDLRRVENLAARLMQSQQDGLARLDNTFSLLGEGLAKVEELLAKNSLALEKLQISSRSRSQPRSEMVVKGHIEQDDPVHGPDFDLKPRPPGPRPRRRIFYYVDHTISCPTNTGMQRVTRRLGAALLSRGEDITFVKWNAEHRKFARLNRNELAFLGKWNGPIPSPEETLRYPDKNEEARLVDLGDVQSASWLLVPEVTHITPQVEPMTLAVMAEGRHLGLFLAFVFYDATPMRRSELKAMSVLHAAYMQQLLLADLVLPISAGASADLCGFFRHYQFADHGPTPRVETLLLPGESQLANRSSDELGAVSVSPFALSVGSIVPHKNQVALIEAFEIYCRRHPATTFQLRLVGNMHPQLHDAVMEAIRREPRIVYMGEVHDDALVKLYRDCCFTVFPSLMEGFGLPILESLWFGKPCICASFGAMGEVAAGGGCLTIDTSSIVELERAITTLIDNPSRLAELSEEAKARHLGTWADYASTLSAKLTRIASPVSRLGTVYYFVDHTARYEGNTGIQRVTRALARSLIEVGVKLVPVMWSAELQSIAKPTAEQIEHLQRWNGPKAATWSAWKPVETASPGDWLLVPELTHFQSDEIRGFARRAKLPCSWIFYDAIPWKLQQLYPPAATQAHSDYMIAMRDVEKVLAISKYSRKDLVEFLTDQPVRCGDLDRHIVATLLPGEFLEAPRVVSLPPPATGRPVRLLSVGTVEPRKNHLGLLAAFKQAREAVPEMELVIAGGAPSQDLARQVQAEVDSVPGVKWIRKVDDRGLHLLYSACDFTVYPSLEEGFGLPILESLWNARPCVCAAFGAMLEVAEGGGCLPVDVADTRPFAEAIASLAGDAGLREQLTREAIERRFRSWHDYALDVATELAGEREAPAFIATGAGCLSAADLTRNMVNLPRQPLLSLCVSTYNRAGWLRVNLQNMTRLLPRPHVDVEILICDNASVDETPEVVKPYLQRSDFRYVRNLENVGMLGNLKVTAQAASGKYIWILGDDDLLMDGTIERVLEVVRAHPNTALVYCNYAFTRIDDAKEVTNITDFLRDGEAITAPTPDHFGTVRDMCARSENFFTAIYCLAFRRDHALRAYSQDTSGRPFATMLTCIPTTYHVLHNMMDEPAFWIGKPAVLVNMNVSWMRYASLWILERLPEAFDLAESRSGDPGAIDVWRRKLVPSVIHWFRDILAADPEGNGSYVSVRRLVNRMKHLPEFRAIAPALEAAYEEARRRRHPLAVLPTERVFIATH